MYDIKKLMSLVSETSDYMGLSLEETIDMLLTKATGVLADQLRYLKANIHYW